MVSKEPARVSEASVSNSKSQFISTYPSRQDGPPIRNSDLRPNSVPTQTADVSTTKQTDLTGSHTDGTQLTTSRGHLSISRRGVLASLVGLGGLSLLSDVEFVQPVAAATTEPDVAWAFAAGDTNIDRAYAIAETTDGAVFAGRMTVSGTPNIWLVKVARQSSTTTVLWNETFGPGTAMDMVDVGDGFVVVSSANSGSDVLLLKVDEKGNEVWRQTYDAGESRREVPRALIQTSDGGFAVTGRSFTGLASTNDAFLLRTDSNGNSSQFHRYPFANIENMGDLVQASDGGFVLAGGEITSGISRGLLIKADASGNLVWKQVFGDPGQQALGIALAPSGYALTTAHGFVLSDANGVTQSPVPYASGLSLRDIVVPPDGGYALAGNTLDNELLLLKVDNRGNELWRKTVAPATGGGKAFGVTPTADDGFLLAGEAHDPDASTQAFIVRFAILFADPLVVDGEEYSPKDLDGDWLYEDIDGDGTVTAEDSTALTNIIKAYRKGDLNLTQAQIDALDFNGDGKLTNADKGAYNVITNQ